MYKNVISRWREFNALKNCIRRSIYTSSVEASKLILTDYQTDDEDVEQVFKIPTIKGMDILRNPKLNKSTAFSITERQVLGIHGLLPPAVNSQQIQTERFMTQFRSLQTDLQKYIAINHVLSKNERLFFKLLTEHTEELLPIVYTPTVGQACQEFGLIFRDPKGLFITIHDLGHVYDIITNWPERRVQAVVMTDGERTLGLGDLGCNAMGIPIGKLSLYTACGGIHPSACLPIMIDVGTNNDALLSDPMYIGLRERRHTKNYDELIDEIIDALRKRYGGNVLIQFEDFAGHNSSRLLDRTRDTICSFNDDIQGTAAVALAGILASLRISKMKITDHTFLFVGAGAAGCGIAHLIVKMLRKLGLSKEEASKKVWMFDVDGLLIKDRGNDKITNGQALFAHDVKHIDNLKQAVEELKPTCLVGVSGVAGAFTQDICHQMTLHCDRPALFALSNPTSHAECTAEQAYTWTHGKCIFASGSPFGPVTLTDGSYFVPSQGNNVYIFPGLALGVIATSSQTIPEDMFLVAAETLANQVSENDLQQGRIYPPLSTIQDVSFQIALSVANVAYKHNVATIVPEPEDKEALIRSMLYNTDYISNIPKTFAYPDDHAEK